jgi:hypothetical protein
MKSSLWLSIGLVVCSSVQAQPGGPDGMPFVPRHPPSPPFHAWRHADEPGPRPGGMVDMLPPGYRTVLFAGLTYFVFHEIWYQLHGDRYEIVPPPVQPQEAATPYAENGLTRVDIDGTRYYVGNGRYYRRNAAGEYLEVTPPQP